MFVSKKKEQTITYLNESICNSSFIIDASVASLSWIYQSKMNIETDNNLCYKSTQLILSYVIFKLRNMIISLKTI